MKRILILMLMVGLASSVEFYNPQNPNSLLISWGIIASIILFISTLLAGLFYMVGVLLGNEKIKTWSKMEVVEIIYSIIILAIIGPVYLSVNQVAEALTYDIDSTTASIVCSQTPVFTAFKINGEEIDFGYGELPCHLKVAKNYLATLFYELAGLVKRVGIHISWYTYLSSFGIDVTPVGATLFLSGASFEIAPLAFLSSAINGLTFIYDSGIKILLVIRFQEILINFIGTALFPVLLCIGVILRSFSGTRKLGGLLMAIAISLYYIYPIFFIIGDSVFNKVVLKTGSRDKVIANIVEYTPPEFNLEKDKMKENSEEGAVKSDFSTSDFYDQLDNLYNSTLCNEQWNYIQSVNENNLNLSSFPSDLALEYQTVGDKLSSYYNRIGVWKGWKYHNIIIGIDSLAKAAFFSLFFSFFGVFATIAAIKILSPILGGDVEIAGLTHLV